MVADTLVVEKNKSKILAASSTLITPVKRRRGHPLGSKNKNSSAAMVGASYAPDVILVQPILPQRSSDNVFCFFTFSGTQ
jgi:hypothetical protein